MKVKKVGNSHFKDKSIKFLKTHFLVKILKLIESKVKIVEDSKFIVKIKKNNNNRTFYMVFYNLIPF